MEGTRRGKKGQTHKEEEGGPILVWEGEVEAGRTSVGKRENSKPRRKRSENERIGGERGSEK